MSHYIDTREQDFIARAKVHYPNAEVCTLEVGDHWCYGEDTPVYKIERKKGHDATDFVQLKKELIAMALDRINKFNIDIQPHLCIYDHYKPYMKHRHNLPITKDEIKHINSLCWQTGVMFHHDKNEAGYFRTIKQIFAGKYDTIYKYAVRIRELTPFQNMLVTYIGISPAKAIELTQDWRYPAEAFQTCDWTRWIQAHFDRVFGLKKNECPKAITEKFLRFWFGVE